MYANLHGDISKVSIIKTSKTSILKFEQFQQNGKFVKNLVINFNTQNQLNSMWLVVNGRFHVF